MKCNNFISQTQQAAFTQDRPSLMERTGKVRYWGYELNGIDELTQDVIDLFGRAALEAAIPHETRFLEIGLPDPFHHTPEEFIIHFYEGEAMRFKFKKYFLEKIQNRFRKASYQVNDDSMAGIVSKRKISLKELQKELLAFFT